MPDHIQNEGATRPKRNRKARPLSLRSLFGMNSGEGGDHSPKNLPLLVAGGCKLGLRHGQHLAFDVEKSLPLANVHLTLAQKMGVKTENFSDATGTLTGLTQSS